VAERRSYYKHPGGVLGFPRRVLRSPAYRDLCLMARCLMLELQDVWSPSNPVIHYSTRRAANALGVSKSAAAQAFLELREHGFIRVVDESDWQNGKARTYSLTWLSHGLHEPANDWLNWEPKLNHTSTGADGQHSNRPLGRTGAKKAASCPTNNQRLRCVFH